MKAIIVIDSTTFFLKYQTSNHNIQNGHHMDYDIVSGVRVYYISDGRVFIPFSRHLILGEQIKDQTPAYFVHTLRARITRYMNKRVRTHFVYFVGTHPGTQ